MKAYHTPTPSEDRGSVPGPDRPSVARCFVCHRLLRDQASIERGCGPVCAERIGLKNRKKANEEAGNVIPLFDLPHPVRRRVTVHTAWPRRPRVTCDICNRRRPAREIHPVSLGDQALVVAACEMCIGAIVRYGETAVRSTLAGRVRSRKAAS